MERDALEQEIAEQEAVLKMLNLQIEQAGGDFGTLAGLTKQLEEAQRKEDAMMERWAYLSDLEEP